MEDAKEELESSQVQDEEMESSTETQVEEATSEQATEKERPLHTHPRFKELINEKNELKSQNQQLMEMMKTLSPREVQQSAEEKIYEAGTPEEREFWQKVEKIAEQKASAREKKLREDFEAEKQLIYKQYGQLAANEFLRNHPDIKRGSEELDEILQEAKSSNLDLEKAYRLVMFDRVKDSAAQKRTQEKAKKLEQKKAANVETSSVNKEAIPQKEDLSLEQEFDRVWDEAHAA